MLSRAGVKRNRKLILVSIQQRPLLLVSGRIESSAFSLSRKLFLLSRFLPSSPSYFPSFLPSFSLSFWFSPGFLPSLSCNAFVGQMHLELWLLSAVTVRICIFVSSRTNLHTCTLPLAGSRSPLVKYARRQPYRFPFDKPDTFVRRFECPGTLPSQVKSRLYPAETIKDADSVDDVILVANTAAQVVSLMRNLRQTAGSIGLYMNANKTEFACFKRERAISTLNVRPLKSVDKFTYLLFTQAEVNVCLAKA